MVTKLERHEAAETDRESLNDRRPGKLNTGLINAFFVPYHKGNPYQTLLASGLRTAGIQVSGGSVKGNLFRLASKGTGTQIIHLHWLPRVQHTPAGLLRLFLFYWRLLVLRLRGVRFVWTVHNLYSHEGTNLFAERWLSRFVGAASSRVIAHSDAAKRLVGSEFDIGADKIVVVPHGNYIGSYQNRISKCDARRQLGIAEDAVVLLFFGNIRPYKGIFELIESYQKLRAQNTCLLIAGRPLNQKIVDEILNCTRQDKSIELRFGFVPDDDVQLYMNASDVVVFPYQDVLTSGAVVLAMSFGRACIAPSIGCIPEMLDERGAFLYNPDDPEGLSGALNRAVLNQKSLASMGEHNLERAAEWSWDKVAGETAQVYRSAMT